MRRRLAPLLATVVALLVLPSTGWAEGKHGHCDEPVATAPAPTAPETAAGLMLEAASAPCQNCHDTRCPDLRHCSAGAAPCLAAASALEATGPCGHRVMGLATISLVPSFSPAPPTPPPNLVAR